MKKYIKNNIKVYILKILILIKTDNNIILIKNFIIIFKNKINFYKKVLYKEKYQFIQYKIII